MALLEREGELGAVLNCCLACEQNNWSEMSLVDIGTGTIYRIYLESMLWSRQAMQGLT